jgi:hypothetical protein
MIADSDLNDSSLPFEIQVQVNEELPIDPGTPIGPISDDVNTPDQNWFILLVLGLVLYFAYRGWK